MISHEHAGESYAIVAIGLAGILGLIAKYDNTLHGIASILASAAAITSIYYAIRRGNK